LQDFNSKEYKEKVAYLETIGVKNGWVFSII
jgi:hypothetical protein